MNRIGNEAPGKFQFRREPRGDGPMPRDESATQKQGRYESWLEVFDSFGVQFLVVDACQDNDLLQAAREHPAWTVDFEDQESVLFARTRMPDPSGFAA